MIDSLFTEHTIDVVITILPFLLYSGLLVKVMWSWRKVRKMPDGKSGSALTALLGMLTLCTLTFMVANAYAIHIWGNTFLSFRVFQMFVLANCVAYWLVLDLVVGVAEHEPD